MPKPPPVHSEQDVMRVFAAVAAADLGIWEYCISLDEFFMSQRAQELVGLSAGPTVRRLSEWDEAINYHPDDRARLAAYRAEVCSKRCFSRDDEFRIAARDGAFRWVRLTTAQFVGCDGKIVRLSGTIKDIHDDRLSLEKLKRAQELYLFADAAGDGHCDWVVETDTFYCSPRFLELCGLPPDTVFEGRKGFIQLFPYHPDDRERVVNNLTALFKSDVTRIETEMRLVVRGDIRWIRVTGNCKRDSMGNLVRWTSAMADITERKRGEEALRQSEERFSLAVAASTDGIWDWDVGNETLFLSDRAQTILGQKPGSAVRAPRDWYSSIDIHPGDVAGPANMTASLLHDEDDTYENEWRVRGQDGIYRWVLVRGLRQRNVAGQVVRVAGSVSDIDEAKRTETARRKAQKLEAMGKLASGIAHDFNNILASVIGYGEMAQRDVSPTSRLGRDLDAVVSAAERGRKLIERILSFTRGGPEDTPVVVGDIIQEVVQQLLPGLPRNVHIETNINSGRAALLGDASAVHQLVSNLVVNGLQAMPNGGILRVGSEHTYLEVAKSVMIGVAKEGPTLILNVSDTGTGIPAEIIDQIFDPFFTTKEVGVGTGLGLSLVHGIVADISGAIDVESEPGKGSTFSVYLPSIGDAPTFVEVEATSKKRTFLRGNGERVMVVDDEEPLVKLTSRTLEWLGYQAKGFVSSREALAAFQAAPDTYDAIITDERMPGLAGFGLVRELRKIRPLLPILLLSGDVSGDMSARARASGVEVLLRKPTSPDDLARGIAHILSRA
jgi:PAS domain S-box-containing protein